MNFSFSEVDKDYKQLSSVIEIILTLSHFQTTVQYSFKLGISYVAGDILQTSVINMKLSIYQMFANKFTAVVIHLTKTMHNECKSAQNKYEILKEEQKRKKQNYCQRNLIRQEFDSLASVIAQIIRNALFLETSLLQKIKLKPKTGWLMLKKANSFTRTRYDTSHWEKPYHFWKRKKLMKL